MDSIEKAIRTALAKGDPGDRTFREKVYRSAFGALDRAITASPNMTEAIAARRRQTLLAAITAIETEFVPAKAAGPEQQSAPVPQTAPQNIQPSVSPAAPPVMASERQRPGEKIAVPTLDGERRPADARKYTDARKYKERAEPRKERSRRRRGLLALLGLVVIAAIGAAWWFAGGGAGLQLTSRPGRPAGQESQPPAPGNIAVLEGWVDIFTPSDPTSVAAPGDSRAEVMEDEEGQFLRIQSGTSNSPVLFDIGQGALEQMAGGRAVFNIDARGADGQATQIAIECSLADLGDCGRKRYDAGATREEYLFDIDLPATQPESGGVITINPDFEGAGRALDIFGIRVLPAL